MDDKEILAWFGNNDNFVACETKEQADEVVDILKRCGVTQGGWSTGTEAQFWGILVSDGYIHAYGTKHHKYSLGTPFDEFMSMVAPPEILVKEILEWFGDDKLSCINRNVVKCFSADEADTVIDVLRLCGLHKPSYWSPRGSEKYFGIIVSSGEIQAYPEGSLAWKEGTPFDEFMSMLSSLPSVEDLI